MKKILALVLAVAAMATVLTACGGGKDVTLKILDTEYTQEDYAIAVAKENTELLDKINEALDALQADGTAQAIVDKYISGVENDLTFQQDVEGKEELVMATNAQFPPYEYYEGETIVGIDAEMAAAIADYLDMKLVINDMDFDATIPAVQTGKADMVMAGLTVTPERQENVNFTNSYATGIQVVIVPEGSPIETVDDLLDPEATYIAGVQKGTTGDTYLSDSYENGGITEERVQKYPSGADAIQALVTGKVDCVVIDNEPAKAFVEANNK